MTENDLQRAVAKVLDYSGLTWFHPPMEGFRTPRTGGHMKAKGSKAGVPDCLIFTPPQMLNLFPVQPSYQRGLALELKVGKNKPTPAQLEWADKLRACGWRVEVCRSLDEVLAVLRECYPAKFDI
jgi:hypothetical protein